MYISINVVEKSSYSSLVLLCDTHFQALGDMNVGFPRETEEKQSTGKHFVTCITDLIWYIEPHLQRLEIQRPRWIERIYSKRTGYSKEDFRPYNDYEAKKKAKPRIERTEIYEHLCKINEFIQTVWMSKVEWKEVKESLEELSLKLEKYHSYLQNKNVAMQELHRSSTPARTPLKDSICLTIEAKSNTISSLAFLDEMIERLELYTPVLLNDEANVSKMAKHARYNFFEKLKKNGLTHACVYFKYTPNAGIETYHFIWKVPNDPSERDDSKYVSISASISSNIPTYHTRLMKTEFKQHFGSICHVSKSVFRAMYSYLTGDQSISSHTKSKKVDARIRLGLMSQDPDFVYDLRELNSGRPEKYGQFWEGLRQILERDFPSAAEDRRQRENVYLPVAVSVRDLIQRVVEEYPGVDTPSEPWILLQFTPKNKCSHAAFNYTSRFDIVYKLQSRSHHKDHPDAYFCMALKNNLFRFSVKYRDVADLFCEDDKHAVNIGEPGDPLSSTDRGRKVMVLKGSEPVAGDHDWHRFKLVPSVVLHNDVPETVDGSFYRGQVYVTVKDAVFEPSTPLRHIVERGKALSVNQKEFKPIQCNYSDGGPDHNPNHYSVKIAQVAHFIEKDLDMMASAVSYPGGSYIDPAERIMPILNIAMNGVALSRKEMSEKSEREIKNWSSMTLLREGCEGNENLKSDIAQSIRPCIDLLNSRYARMSLKDQQFQIGTPASSGDIQMLFDNMKVIDDDLLMNETTKQMVGKRPKFLHWMEKHSRERRYIFQLMKCNNSPINISLRLEAIDLISRAPNINADIHSCLEEAVHFQAITCQNLWDLVTAAQNGKQKEDIKNIIDAFDNSSVCKTCKPPRLNLEEFMKLHWVPDPMPRADDKSKYLHFEDLYGKDTNDNHRPSRSEDLDADIKHMLTKEKARGHITCVDCFKPRVVYGDSKSWKDNKDVIDRHFEVIISLCI